MTLELFLLVLIAFIIGTALGSFLSVVIYRTLKGENGIILGRSKCTNCNQQLQTKDLMPVLSYLLNWGKCRFCSAKIDLHYIYLEIITGIFIAFNTYMAYTQKFPFNNLNQDLASFSIFALSILIILNLITISFSDLKEKAIPNIFLYSLIVLTVTFAIISGINSLTSILIAIAINLLFFGTQWLVSKGKWLGSGDIFIGLAMAILLGYQKFLVAIVFTYIIGSIISIFVLINKKNKNNQIAFAPFLAIATLIAFYFGEIIIDWYLSTDILNIYSYSI